MRREQGAALLVAVMMLALMGMIGLAALDTTSQDRQVAGFQSRARTAFYAAEAGLSQSKEVVRNADPDVDPTPAFAAGALGDAGIYPHGQPSYQGDPNAGTPDPIQFVRKGKPWDEGGDIRTGKQRLVHLLWQINVQGQTSDGSISRIESVRSQLGAENYGGG
jgi:Tfp pilus assembly protein PilX